MKKIFCFIITALFIICPFSKNFSVSAAEPVSSATDSVFRFFQLPTKQPSLQDITTDTPKGKTSILYNAFDNLENIKRYRMKTSRTARYDIRISDGEAYSTHVFTTEATEDIRFGREKVFGEITFSEEDQSTQTTFYADSEVVYVKDDSGTWRDYPSSYVITKSPTDFLTSGEILSINELTQIKNDVLYDKGNEIYKFEFDLGMDQMLALTEGYYAGLNNDFAANLLRCIEADDEEIFDLFTDTEEDRADGDKLPKGSELTGHYTFYVDSDMFPAKIEYTVVVHVPTRLNDQDIFIRYFYKTLITFEDFGKPYSFPRITD